MIEFENTPQYQSHEWGTSLRLTPDNCDQEVVIACVSKPRIFSSVHYHEFKHNRLICNNGRLLIEFFPYGISENDLQNKTIEESDRDFIVLLPGSDVQIEAGMDHRICGLDELTFFTEIYTSTDSIPPHHSDIVRVIPAGDKYHVPVNKEVEVG